MDYKDIITKVEGIKKSHPDNIMAKHFDVKYFESLNEQDKKGFIQCCKSGIDNPDSAMGCYAMQPQDYDTYKPFFQKVLSEYHKVPLESKHVNNWSFEGVFGMPSDGVLDLTQIGLKDLSMRVRVGRNLQAFPLPGHFTFFFICLSPFFIH
eukprot:GHVR01024062.1.p1 GENE.GHVR01024062.1~~GHVR01024062.1.p1  ORF type:complete len:170 (+),score=29.12 GHVR01024062.1:60-512(+)